MMCNGVSKISKGGVRTCKRVVNLPCIVAQCVVTIYFQSQGGIAQSPHKYATDDVVYHLISVKQCNIMHWLIRKCIGMETCMKILVRLALQYFSFAEI